MENKNDSIKRKYERPVKYDWSTLSMGEKQSFSEGGFMQSGSYYNKKGVVVISIWKWKGGNESEFKEQTEFTTVVDSYKYRMILFTSSLSDRRLKHNAALFLTKINNREL